MDTYTAVVQCVCGEIVHASSTGEHVTCTCGLPVYLGGDDKTGFIPYVAIPVGSLDEYVASGGKVKVPHPSIVGWEDCNG